MNNIKTLYYIYYRWSLKRKSDKSPEHSALLGVAGILFINIITIIFGIYILSGILITSYISGPLRIVFMLLYLSVFVILFFSNGRYKRIINEIEKIPLNEITRKNSIVKIYTVSSVILFLLLTIGYSVYSY